MEVDTSDAHAWTSLGVDRHQRSSSADSFLKINYRILEKLFILIWNYSFLINHQKLIPKNHGTMQLIFSSIYISRILLDFYIKNFKIFHAMKTCKYFFSKFRCLNWRRLSQLENYFYESYAMTNRTCVGADKFFIVRLRIFADGMILPFVFDLICTKKLILNICKNIYCA